MQLRRVEVRNFRRLTHRVIEGLGDGLNVIVGDNEAGKSTLLAALRAVLFERHRVGGKVLDAMLPHGHDLRPEIALDFTLAGRDYRLRKAYNQRPEAELIGPGGERAAGEAVEERLAALLGFAPPGNRGSKPDEHQGIYGLLWVEQGAGHQRPQVGAGQDTLSSALESEVGLVLGGERGRRLLSRAEQRRDAFWDKREKPRGSYKQLGERVEALVATVANLRERLGHHDRQVAALGTRQEALARHRRDDRLGQAVRDAETARATAARTDQIAATLGEARRTQERVVAERDAAADRVAMRRQLLARLAAAGEAARRAGSESAEAGGALDRAERAAREALGRRDAARTARRAAEDRLGAAERRAARRRARDELARVGKALAEAEDIAARRRDLSAVAASVTLTKADLASIDRATAELEQARARQDAASVQIHVEGVAAGPIAVDGVPHGGDEPLLLARDAVLDLPGFGRLRVRPGGGAGALARAVDEAERQLATLLGRLNCADRARAAGALARRAEAEAEALMLQRVFAAVAPAGLDALSASVAGLRLEAGPEDGDVAPDDALGDRASLREALDRARAEDAEAEANSTRADAARQGAAQTAAALAERVSGTAREAALAEAALADARAAHPDDRLQAALAETEARLRAAEDAALAAAAALAGADPETAALALKRAENAERAIRADIDALTRDKRDLEVELRTLGQEGLGEQLAEAEGQLAAARRQLGDRDREAAASRLLHATLADAQRDSKERWLGPVRDRVGPYLRLLQPDSEIVLNEKTFAIEHLVRGGVAEPFENLSIGAREQVAVITRLALADILRGSGHPAAMILDDALVNTDEGRLDRMHLVLQRAATNLQVLVLTCRERDFLGLGAPIHRL